MLPTAASPTTAAAIARPMSRVLTAGRPATGAAAARGAAAAERVAAGAAAAARGALGGRAAAALGADAGGAAAGPPVGPPGGSVGSLMVGAAEGLGGKLIRTVSFLGWTFPVSFFGGTAPLGTLGIFSAIKLILLQTRVAVRECQTLITAEGRGKSAVGKSSGLRSSARSSEMIGGCREAPNRFNGLSPLTLADRRRESTALHSRFAGAAPVAAVAWGALFPRPGYVHGQRPALKFLVVELLDGFVGLFGRREFNEGEAA